VRYEFGPFRLDSVRHALLREGQRVPLHAKALDLLLLIVQHHGSPLSKEELVNRLWGVGVIVTDNNFNVTLRAARRALGDSARDSQYILTTSEGYCFVASVKELQDEEPKLDETSARFQETASQRVVRPHRGSPLKVESPFGGHRFYVLSACLFYASLYGVALLSEVAYQFDRYGPTALRITPLVVCWIFLTSVSGLTVDWRWTLKGRSNALALSALIFLVAAAILFVALRLFLPASPITEATFQTYTAQAAYLKDICYFFPLVLLFLITPFHFVIAMQRELSSRQDCLAFGLLTGDRSSVAPKGSIYFRTWVMGCILVLLVAYFLIARARLLDNLSPGPYINLFEQLIHLRLILYFGLAVQCFAWYYRALNELKRQYLATAPP